MRIHQRNRRLEKRPASVHQQEAETLVAQQHFLQEQRIVRGYTILRKFERRRARFVPLWHGFRAEFFAAMWKEQDTRECYAGGSVMSIPRDAKGENDVGLCQVRKPRRRLPDSRP